MNRARGLLVVEYNRRRREHSFALMRSGNEEA